MRHPRGRGVDAERRHIDAADLLRSRMDMDEPHARVRNVDEAVALARDLAEPAAEHDQQVCRLDAGNELGLAPRPRSRHGGVQADGTAAGGG